MNSRTWVNLIVSATLVLIGATTGLAQEPNAAAIVSAASFQEGVSPNSIASIFGTNLVEGQFQAEFDENGHLPTVLGGISVEIDGIPAQLIFASPTQINLVIPEGVVLGLADVRIVPATGEEKGEGAAGLQTNIDLTAPGIFAIRFLRGDQGAVLNGVTYRTGPFQVTTPDNPGDDSRTRLAIFATGIRYAGNPERQAGVNVAESLTLEATDLMGDVFSLDLEYAGPTAEFAGLDQLNAVLGPELDGKGLLWLRIRDGEKLSNATSVVIAPDSVADPSLLPSYQIDTVAATGEPGYAGDGSMALGAQVQTPLAVAVDSYLNLFVADSDNGVVRRVDAATGMITTVAGTVEKGDTGDGGLATDADLGRPAGLAVDDLGNLFIADMDNHRVRRVDSTGIITTVAGTGVAGFSGDGGLASAAQLSSPADIALNPHGSLVIADTGNNRVRLVTGDGLIQTIAGTGEAGFSGDAGPATEAQLDAPTSVAIGGDGTVFVSDSGNQRIRRIDVGGTISTLVAGETEKGAVNASLESASWVELGPWGRPFIGGGGAHTVQLIDTTGALHDVAGTGEPGFSGDGGPALLAQLYMPLGLAVDPVGDVFIPDAGNHRVRKLWTQLGDDCGEVADIVISPTTVIGGESSMGYVRLTCPVDTDTTVTLMSDDPRVIVPATVVIPAGETTVGFQILTAPPQVRVFVTVTGTTGGSTGTGGLTLLPPSDEQRFSVRVNPNVLTGGETATGVVTLANPAPEGGLDIDLLSNDAAADVAASVHIPEGHLTAEFLVTTDPVETTTSVMITGMLDDITEGAVLLVLPEGDNAGSLPRIGSLTLDPSTVDGGESSEGTVTLTEPALEGGVVVLLTSGDLAADIPAYIVIPEGETSAVFEITTSNVPSLKVVAITATAGNTVSANLRIQTGGGDGPGEGTISGVSVSPSSVEGGDSATGTVTLSEPAPAGGILVELSSDSDSADVPNSIVIFEGETEGTFNVSTSSVEEEAVATITATSANSASDTLTIQPGAGGGPGEGTISGLSISPNSVQGGDSAVGTVTLSEPAPAGGVLVELSSDSDSADVPNSIIISEGETEGTFNVSTSSVEEETIAMITATSANSASDTLTIQPGEGGGPGEGTISGVSISPSSVEGGESATGTVTLSNPAPSGGILVDLSSDDGAADVPNSIIIPEGETEGMFNVSTSSVEEETVATITATSANSASDTLTIEPESGGGGPGEGTISSVSISPSSVEGGDSATGTVTLSDPAPEGGVLVELSSDDGAADVPNSIVIPEGETEGTFNVSTSSVEEETVATITATSANSASDTLTIQPGEGGGPGEGTISGVSISPSSVEGGESATGTVTLSNPAPSGGILVDLSSDDGAADVPNSIIIPEGETEGTFNVSTSTVEEETVATITATSANSASDTLTIEPESGGGGPGEGTISSVSISPSSVDGGDSATGTVTLSNPAPEGGILVELSSNDNAADVPNSIVIPEGETQGTFEVETSPVGEDTVATITATSANSASDTLTIKAPCVDTLTLTVDSVLGGDSITGTVTLTSPAPAGGSQITLVSSDAEVSVPSKVTVLAGQTTANFQVTTVGVATLLVATIEALFGDCPGITVDLEVEAPILESLGLSSPTVALLGSVTGTVNLNGPAPAGGLEIDLGSDFDLPLGNILNLTIPSSVTVEEGETSADFQITALGTLLQAVTGSITATLDAVVKTKSLTITLLP